MYTVIISFKKEYSGKKSNIKKILNFYNSDHPIAKYSGGSMVAVIDSDIWLDFYKVPSSKIISFIKYLDKIEDEDLKANIYLKIEK